MSITGDESEGTNAGFTTGSRAENIYRRIFDAVMEQRLPPGAKLAEEQLGAVFGVGRAIVRNALQALAHDHIVAIERHRGAFVSAPTIEDARDIFESRRLVEAGVAQDVAGLINARDVATLKGLLDQESQALDQRDRRAAIRLSGEFHMAIARIRGEGAITRFLSGLISRSSLVIALYGRGPASACGHGEHAMIVEALAMRDGPRAAALMTEHLAHILSDLALSPRVEQPFDLAEILRSKS